MRRVEEAAGLSRWRERTLETGVLCLGLGTCAISIPSVAGGISVLVVVFGLAVLAGVPLRTYSRKFVLAGGFALVAVIPLSVGLRAWPRWELFFDPLGFQGAILAGVRAMATLSVTLLLVFTTPFGRLLGWLRWMRFPDALVDLCGLVHREIFQLDETFSRMRRALASRNGWRGTHAGMRSLSLGLAALLVQALERSDRLERGLASRTVARERSLLWESEIDVRPASLVAAMAVPALLAVWIFVGMERCGF